jgi:hypothetical protein
MVPSFEWRDQDNEYCIRVNPFSKDPNTGLPILPADLYWKVEKAETSSRYLVVSLYAPKPGVGEILLDSAFGEATKRGIRRAAVAVLDSLYTKAEAYQLLGKYPPKSII